MPESAVRETKHQANLQTLTIPFQVPRRGPCTATITIEPNDDPLHTGQDLVAIHVDPLVTKGFPLLKATISSPVSRIYASIYGWVQLTSIPSEDWTMDIYPTFEDLNYPFAMWGSEPTLIDAPNRDKTDPKWEGYDWYARTFLTYDLKAAMQKMLVPILGFEWGFKIVNGEVLVKELRRLDLSAWNEHLDLLRGKYPGWEFKDAEGTS